MAKCIWNGIEYKTRREAARANGVSEAAMTKRFKAGWKCDADIPERVLSYPIVFKTVYVKK